MRDYVPVVQISISDINSRAHYYYSRRIRTGSATPSRQTNTRPDLAVRPVRFWPYQFSLVLIKKPGKTDIYKIRYTFNHVQKWETLLWVLQQYSLICQKFRWCLSSLTSDISEKSFWKDESFKAWTKVVY